MPLLSDAVANNCVRFCVYCQRARGPVGVHTWARLRLWVCASAISTLSSL